jgi:L-glyceraldehyde 3-phosphate reductase
VHAGKALYVGISNYSPDQTARAALLLKQAGTPCLIHQPRYSLFERTPERGLLEVLERDGLGCIVFSPLAQGVLSNRYLNGIPSDARAAKDPRFLKPEQLTPETLRKVEDLNRVAEARGQSLAQMALAWVLRKPVVTSALIGASSASQIEENVAATKNLGFDAATLSRIDAILASPS